jgi:hypothetical protein
MNIQNVYDFPSTEATSAVALPGKLIAALRDNLKANYMRDENFGSFLNTRDCTHTHTHIHTHTVKGVW